MMYLSSDASRLRNRFVAFTSGSLTLVILLIAPLGLAAVIVNTFLVTVTVYGVSEMTDRAIAKFTKFPGQSPSSFPRSTSPLRKRGQR